MTLTETGDGVTEWRCPTCGSLLFRAIIRLDAGELVEAYCKSCKAKVVFVAQPGKSDAA